MKKAILSFIRWGGFGFLLFAKLAGHITWPWWIVTAPVWAPWAMWAIFGGGLLMLAGFLTIAVAYFESTTTNEGKTKK